MRKGEEMAFQKTEDHWAFLEEIEAPMWVDLNLAVKSVKQEIDDDWFHRSHLFHQCSSCELKHLFSHNAVGNSEPDFNLQGSSSPKLPTSVSGSRGKHYKSRKWGTKNFDLLLNKKHPVKTLTGKGSQLDPEPIKEEKLKSRPWSSKTSLVYQNGAAVPNYRRPISTFGDSKASLDSAGVTTSEGNSSSTITSISSQQKQQQFSEVSSQTSNGFFDHKIGLLAALRTNIRKSCVTRQAYRVEINDGGQSKGGKSSSGKSSVGSSSDFGCDAKKIASKGIRKKEQTANSSVMGMNRAAKNSVKVVSASKESTNRVEDRTSNSKRGGNSVGKPTHKEAAKSKALRQTVHGNASVHVVVDERHPLTVATIAKDKVGVRKCNRSLQGGKENVVGRMDGSQRFCKKDCSTGCKVQHQRLTTEDALKKAEKAKMAGIKDKVSRTKTQMNAAKEVYLR